MDLKHSIETWTLRSLFQNLTSEEERSIINASKSFIFDHEKEKATKLTLRGCAVIFVKWNNYPQTEARNRSRCDCDSDKIYNKQPHNFPMGSYVRILATMDCINSLPEFWILNGTCRRWYGAEEIHFDFLDKTEMLEQAVFNEAHVKNHKRPQDIRSEDWKKVIFSLYNFVKRYKL